MRLSIFRRYNTVLFGAVLAWLSLIIGVSILIDPYGYYHGVRWPGVNEIKPRAYVHARLAKQASARRVYPRTVILGNSRMDIGLDPQSAEWAADMHPVFNLAIPGHGLKGDLDNLNAVFSATHPREVVVGIEFLDFLFDNFGGRSLSATSPTALDELVSRLGRFSATAMSLTALVDSIDTLRQRNNPRAETMTSLGFNPLHQYLDFVDEEGHGGIFRQKNIANIRTFLRKPMRVVADDGTLSSNFGELSTLLEWCRRRGVRIKLVIYPYHTDLLEGFRLTGLWLAFEEWKRQITRIVASAQSAKNPADIALWDFSGYHEFASERVPAVGDTRTHMRWYWEAGHFKSTLGDEMLRRMLVHDAGIGFGRLLTRSNVDEVIDRIREDGRAFRVRHPNSSARIEKILRRLQSDHPRS